MTPAEAAAVVDALGQAFLAGDVPGVLSQFCADDPVVYAGSEAGELAVGRANLGALLADLFARGERYSWFTDTATVVPCGTAVAVLADVTLLVHPWADGTLGPVSDRVPYRVSGALEPAGDGWRWRLCQGSEPTEP
jgi:hypothetical protein